MGESSKVYSVWVGGTEVNDYYLTYKEALNIYKDYVRRGYSPIIRKEI